MTDVGFPSRPNEPFHLTAAALPLWSQFSFTFLPGAAHGRWALGEAAYATPRYSSLSERNCLNDLHPPDLTHLVRSFSSAGLGPCCWDYPISPGIGSHPVIVCAISRGKPGIIRTSPISKSVCKIVASRFGIRIGSDWGCPASLLDWPMT